MKAILIHVHGGLEVLQFADFKDPEPVAGQALIKLHAAALNRMDLLVRRGWPGLKLEYPHIPGADGAGQVVAIKPLPSSEEEQGVKEGDRVVINSNLGCGNCDYCLAGQDNLCRDWHLLGETIRGTYAEYVALPLRQLFRLPESIDYQTAAAAGLVFHTAWHSLITRGKLQSGETVLVVGASGGVNTASIQIAKHFGAKVIVVGAGKYKLALAESLGADILIDRLQEEDWSKVVYLVTQKGGVDVAIDNVGATFPLSLRCLRKGGRLLTVGNTSGPKFEIDNRFIFGKHLTIIGSTMGTLKDFADVMNLVSSRKLKVAIDRSFPLADARSAQERLEKGEQLGKITLEI